MNLSHVKYSFGTRILFLPFLATIATASLAQQPVGNDSLRTSGYYDGSNTSQVRVIDEKQMNNKDQATNALDAIRGRVAGMQIEKGGANAMSAVRLRGTTSLTGGNDPLIIVDGVMGDLTLLQSVYPTDIQSFAILKDASETAQYGSRGAAGVIEVSTMRGQSGRTRINYNGSMAVSSIYKRLQMLGADDYRQYALQNGLSLVDLGASSNFQKQIERTGFTNQHHVAFAGGNENSSYRVAVGYQNEQTVIKNMGSQAFMANMNMTQTMWDGLLRIDVGMFGSTQQDKSIFDEQKLFYSAAAWNPTFPDHRNSSGSWDGYPSASQINNPNALLEEKNHTNNAHISTHAKLKFQLLPQLNLTIFGAYTYDNDELQRYLPSSVWNGGQANRTTTRKQSLLANAILNFNKKWKRHAFNATALAEVQSDKLRGYGVQVNNFSTDLLGYDNLAGGALRPWDGTTSFYEKPSMVSFMGQAGYTFNERYSLNATLRADASSKFGDNHKWGYFPSVSASWNLSKEHFMQNLSFINDLRLNVGLGWAGNQGGIDNYTTLALLNPEGIAAAGMTNLVTFSELKNQNPDLKWEVTRTFNVGLDAQLFRGRLVFSASYYHSKTYDMLYPYPVSVPPFKYPKLVANMGSMRNKGLELSVGGTPLVSHDMELTINTNLSFPRNKLLSLSGEYGDEYLFAPSTSAIASLNGAGFHGYNDVVFQSIGHPLGIFLLPHADGLTSDTDGNYTYNITTESQYAGQAMPRVLMGSNISFRYRDFDISLQANGAFGHKIFNGTSLSYMNLSSLPLYNVLDKAPSAGIKDQTVSDYWLENGNYVNIDYITVGWHVPLKKNRVIESMRLSLTMNNVVTFTSYSGLTPIINSSNVSETLGLDDKRTYPLYHTYTLGVSLSF